MDKSKLTKAQLLTLLEEQDHNAQKEIWVLQGEYDQLKQDFSSICAGYRRQEELLADQETTIETLTSKVKELQNELNELMKGDPMNPAPRRVKDEDLHKLHAWAWQGYNCRHHVNHPRLIKGLAAEADAIAGLRRGNVMFKVQGNDIYFPR